MSPSTFNESDVARHKAGQPTGGQFAEQAKAASGLALSASEPPAVSDTEAIGSVRAALARLEAMSKAKVSDSATETGISAHAVASLTRAAYPQATTITTGECDQWGCTRQHLLTALDADGNVLTDDLAYDLENDPRFSAEVEDTLYELEAALTESSGAFQMHYSFDGGAASSTIDVDQALTYTPPSERARPQDRARASINAYRARFDGLDLDDRTAARRMLADLVTWAGENDVDVRDLLARPEDSLASSAQQLTPMKVRMDPEGASRTAAVGLAKTIRDRFPEAHTVVTRRCGTSACARQHVAYAVDAAGTKVMTDTELREGLDAEHWAAHEMALVQSVPGTFEMTETPGASPTGVIKVADI